MARYDLPEEATGLRLAKFNKREELILCETVLFPGGRDDVDMILRRAAVSGRVEIDVEGKLPDYFADIMDKDGSIIGEVALDSKSYGSLKNHWMRCKIDRLLLI